jgi:hypothetical protein
MGSKEYDAQLFLRLRNDGLREATNLRLTLYLDSGNFTWEHILDNPKKIDFNASRPDCIPTPDHACSGVKEMIVVYSKTIIARFPRFPAGADIQIEANVTGAGISFPSAHLTEGRSDQGELNEYSLAGEQEEVSLRNAEFYGVLAVLFGSLVYIAFITLRKKAPSLDVRILPRTLAPPGIFIEQTMSQFVRITASSCPIRKLRTKARIDGEDPFYLSWA